MYTMYSLRLHVHLLILSLAQIYMYLSLLLLITYYIHYVYIHYMCTCTSRGCPQRIKSNNRQMYIYKYTTSSKSVFSIVGMYMQCLFQDFAQEGANAKCQHSRGEPHIKDRESQMLRGGKSILGVGAKSTPWPP